MSSEDTTTWKDRFLSLYHLELRLLGPVQDLFLLLARGYFGYRFFRTGLGKLQNLEQTTGFFDGLGIPFPGLNAILAGSTECVGGLLLLLGLCSRVVPIPLIGTMIVAYLTAHIEAVQKLFSDPSVFMDQEPFLFLIVSLLVLLFGPGRISLDFILMRALGLVDRMKGAS